jgi:hypothetical protein
MAQTMASNEKKKKLPLVMMMMTKVINGSNCNNN